MNRAYTVAEGTQIHHLGRTYVGGDRINADPDTARLWLSAGWVTEVKPASKRAKSVEDKSTA